MGYDFQKCNLPRCYMRDVKASGESLAIIRELNESITRESTLAYGYFIDARVYNYCMAV